MEDLSALEICVDGVVLDRSQVHTLCAKNPNNACIEYILRSRQAQDTHECTRDVIPQTERTLAAHSIMGRSINICSAICRFI
jgi:hypothetical protein